MAQRERKPMTDDDYDIMDAYEDQALARLRDADAWSEEETDEEELLDCSDPYITM